LAPIAFSVLKTIIHDIHKKTLTIVLVCRVPYHKSHHYKLSKLFRDKAPPLLFQPYEVLLSIEIFYNERKNLIETVMKIEEYT